MGLERGGGLARLTGHGVRLVGVGTENGLHRVGQAVAVRVRSLRPWPVDGHQLDQRGALRPEVVRVHADSCIDIRDGHDITRGTNLQ